MKYKIGTEADCKAYQSLCDKLLGLPIKSRPVGKGKHVTPSVTPGVPGWSVHYAEPRQHPTNKALWAHAVVDPDKQGNVANLNAIELAALRDAYTEAVDLDSSWEPTAQVLG
jgi:hypothetical protein